MTGEKEDKVESLFTRRTIVRSLITLAVLAALYLLVRRLSGVLLPFLISFVVAYMLDPVVDFFQYKCKLKNRALSVVITLLLVIGVLTGAIAAVVPAISRQANSLSQSVKTYVQNFHGNEYFSPRLNAQIEEIFESMDVQSMLHNSEVQETIKELLPMVGDWINSGMNALTSLAIVFICVLYIIFLLIDYDKITNNWQKYIPERWREGIVMIVSDLDRNMNAYFRGKASVAAIVGILFAIGFQIIGLPMGIAMGLMIGLLNLVPYLQTIGIPPCILLALIQASETGRPIWVALLCLAAVFIIVQCIQDMFLVPYIMGGVTGMGPAWILLSLSIWGSLLGFVGMIIALPITSMLVSYYKRFVLHMTDSTPKPQQRSLWNIPFLKRKKKK